MCSLNYTLNDKEFIRFKIVFCFTRMEILRIDVYDTIIESIVNKLLINILLLKLKKL